MNFMEKTSEARQDDFNLSEAVLTVRSQIGNLEGSASPSEKQVANVVESLYPDLPAHKQAKIVETFMHSERSAAEEADRLAEEGV